MKWNTVALTAEWRQFWKRYQLHYGFAAFGLITLLLLEDRPADIPLTFWQTLSLQVASIFSLAVTLTLTHAMLMKTLPDWMRRHFWLGHGVTILLANIPTVIFDYVTDGLGVTVGLFHNDSYPADMSFWQVFALEYISDLKYIVFFWVCSETIYIQLNKMRQVNVLPTILPSVAQPWSGGFLSKIPLDYQTTIEVIEAQQNYIKVYTADKHFMVLYRFGKAIEELGESRGAKIHRSFWVSYTAMTGIAQTGSQCFLLTKNGMRVPVSRSFRERVKQLDLPQCE